MLKLGIIGVGNIGSGHVERVTGGNCPDITITAVADRRASRREWAKKALPETQIFVEGSELIKSGACEAVLICTPHYQHPTLAVEAFEAGLHVLCEKPMALSSADCAEMIETAKECGKKLMIGQCLRFEPLYLVLKNAIEEGTFGKVKAAYFDRFSSLPRWGFDGWYRDTARSGGAIMDLHIHDVDMVRFLFGEPNFASAVSYDTVTRWTVINSRFLYDDGKIVVANASWDEANSTKFTMNYRVNFEKATVILQNGTIMVYPVDGEPYEAVPGHADRMAEEIRFLAMSILEDSENVKNPPESAMMTVKLVETLRESAAQNGANVAF